MEIKFISRSFSAEVNQPRGDYHLKKMSWSAIGGPDEATFEVVGQDTWEMFERLRFGIEIFNNQTTKLWWGFVNSVDIYDGIMKITIALDEMSNRVRVSYSKVSESGTQEGKGLTNWISNSESISIYGKKEKKYFLSSGTNTQANSYRNMLLERYKYPISGVKFSEKSEVKAVVRCQGWWKTLDWLYYSNASAVSISTTNQISNIVSQCGQYLNGTDIETVSGITTSSKRDGDKTGLEEIIDLLNTGTSNNLRLLCEVDAGRRLKVYEEQIPKSNDMLLTKTGEFYNYMGVSIPKESVRPGKYVVLKDLLPANVDVSRIADISRIFIETVIYHHDDDRLEITPRDQTKFLNFGGV